MKTKIKAKMEQDFKSRKISINLYLTERDKMEYLLWNGKLPKKIIKEINILDEEDYFKGPIN